jgi:hypothetical protein
MNEEIELLEENQNEQSEHTTGSQRWERTRTAFANGRTFALNKTESFWLAVFPPKDEQAEQGENSFFNLVLQIVLWLAFGAFLLASLPHVAYFFASFEPQEWTANGPQVNDYWWTISYCLAFAIDVTSFLLSLNVAIKMRRATNGLSGIPKLAAAFGVMLTHWPFILLLVGFSWLVNYEHAQQFHSDMLSLAEQNTINLVIWSGSIRDLNPVIASAFPVLAVAYTGMSDRVKAERKAATNANTTTSVVEANATSPNANGDIQQLATLITEMNEQHRSDMERMMNLTLKAITANANANALPANERKQLRAPRTRTRINARTIVEANDQPEREQERANEPIPIDQNVRERVRSAMQNHPGATVGVIANAVGISKSTAHKWMTKISEEESA